MTRHFDRAVPLTDEEQLAKIGERRVESPGGCVLVQGKYTLPTPADETSVVVKIIDMLGEEIPVTE